MISTTTSTTASISTSILSHFPRTDTNLPEYSFDAIIDKGLLDSILCGQCGAIDTQVYIIEIERLLKDTGVFICVSHGNPDERLHFLEQYDIDEPYYTVSGVWHNV